MKFKRSLLVVAAALVGVLLTVQMFAAFNTAEAGRVTAPVSVEPAAAVEVAAWETITFDSSAVSYTLTGFGGADDSSVVVDPTDGANKVAKVVKSGTAELWAGTTVSTEPNMAVPALPFTASDTTMTVRVWSPDAGIQVRLKVENAADPTKSVETEATTTVANGWETLTFNFANQVSGTAALDLTYTYNKVSIFFNFGVTGATAGEKTYYFDDVAFGGGGTTPPPSTWETITFDSTTISYTLTGFGGADDSSVVVDPTDGANYVAKVVKSATAELWAGTTVSTEPNNAIPALPFTASDTTMTVRVWSPDAGIQVRLKVEDAADPTKSVETEATTTVANGWETLTFNFANQVSGTAALDLTYTYNKASIFFNFGVTGATAGEKTYYFDDVAFGGGGTTPPPPPPAPAANTLPIITDFESGIPSTLGVFNGSGSSVALAVDTQAVPQMPSAVTNTVAIVTYTIGAGDYGGITQPFTETQDWTGYEAFGFWYYGSNSGVNHRIELKSQGGTAGAANLWQYPFADDFVGWKHFVVPFSDFTKRTDYNPGAGLGDSIDQAAMWGWSLLLDPNASGTVWMDDVRLFKTVYGEDFETGLPAGLGVFNGGGSSVSLAVATQPVPGKVPGSASSGTIVYTYTIGAGDYGGITFPFTASQDWTGAQSFGFWIKGSNSGVNHRIELKSQGGDAGAANLWQYGFADDFTDWKYFQVPFSDFAKRTDYNPGAGLGDSIDLAVMWGWSILLDPNSTGTIVMDDVAAYGKPADVLKVAFTQAAYSVVEGGTASINVALNVAAADTVTVTYATADGTATAGADYTATTGSLVFAPGDLTKSFTVETTDDADVEGAETVNLTLSVPEGVELGTRSSAALTIKDNDQAPPVVGGHSVVVDSYEYTNGLPTGNEIGTDPATGKAYTVPVGYVTWSYNNTASAMTLTVPAEQRPGAPANNQVMQLDVNLPLNQWGGFSHNFENPALDKWMTQDWSTYEGVSFWLYGNNTGGIIFLDIMDNRTPGSIKDDAERWSKDIPDDFSGWKYIEIPFSEFNRKDIGNGAPDDGFNKTEINGYGIGGYSSAPMLNQVYYIDNLGLIPRTTVVDSYEYTNGLPTGNEIGTDPATGKAYTVPVGYVTWSYNNTASAMTLTVPTVQRPGAPANNQVMQLDVNLPLNQWGGFSHNFENPALDKWMTQDWSTYEGVCFWLYGNNTGGIIFLDIMDNRTLGSTKDDAERWSKDIPDDFSGWKFIQIPFSEFNRKDIGNGAPDDGFNKTQINGYGIGGYSSAPMLNQTYYIDDFTIYGNTGNAPKPLELAFSAAKYSVTEGQTAVMTVSLATTSTLPVTVTYKSLEGTAMPGVDYTPVSGTLVFAPGEMDKTISVPTLEDTKFEGNEAVMVNLYDVNGAAFGFQRRAMLTIVDDETADPADLGDFEGSSPFVGVGGVSLSITQLGSADPNAVPGQGVTEQVLTVEYNDAFTSTNRILNTFTTPQDWSGADGLSFWYFGNNTGKTINVELWDNQITGTNALTATDWVMRWADEFNEVAGTPPNPNNWQHEIGDGTLNGIPGWGNSEFEYYTDDPANASTDGNGNLVISLKALDAATTDKVCYYGPCRYTSARLKTENLAEFQYGKIEARMKLPPTNESGIWPAFWSLGSNINEGVDWPQSGEIDIMEYVSRIPNEIFGTLHGPGYSGGVSYGQTVNVPNLLDDYHTYTIEWWENHIIWYIDGVKYHEARNTDSFLSGKEWVYNQPFFLLLNVAIGGNFGGAISDQMTFPQDTLVDYVRVYQAPNAAELFESSFVDNFTGWKKVFVPFSSFTRSAEQAAGAPDDGLTLTSVNGYGFRFPSGSTGLAAQAQVTTHIDQVRLVTFVDQWIFPMIFKSGSLQPGQ